MLLKVMRNTSAALALLLILLAAVFSSCDTKNVGTLPGPGTGGNDNTAVVEQEETVTGAAGAQAVVPAGTTVTSTSVAGGEIDLSAGDVPGSVMNSFSGEAYGSVAMLPVDAEFDRAVSISVPAGSASGTIGVYRYNMSSTSAIDGWTRIGEGTPEGGVVTVTTTRFGYFVAGDEVTMDMPEITVDVPTAMEAGQDAMWEASWTGGEAPYSVDWNFGGGADPNTAADTGAMSPASHTVTMLNTTDTDAEYTYTITVTDANGNGDTASAAYTVAPAPVVDNFRLTLFHNNDGESRLINAGSGELPDGGDLSSFGGAAYFVSKVEELRGAAMDTYGADATMTVSSGDNFLAGAEFNASVADGTYYDARVLEAIGYDAICLGNHDFDFGPETLAEMIGSFDSDPRYLSCNLDFSGEPMLDNLVGSRIFESVVVEKGGRQIGIIGATTESLDFISSPRGVTTQDAVSEIQAEIDALTGDGVDIILLISHMQGVSGEYGDEAIMAQLSGVDFAVAGGGDELLTTGDASENLIPGDEESSRSYPLYFTDADGNDVPVVTTPGNYKYVGQLTVEFDDDGNLLGVIDEFSGLQRVANSNYPDAVDADNDVYTSAVQPVEAYVAALESNVIGTTEVPLNGQRGSWDEGAGMPEIVGVRNSETNLGNIDADALLWQANQLAESYGAPLAHIGLQNGGGMRNDAIIPVGDITEMDTYAINAFPNYVTILEGVTHSRLRDILEAAVSGVQHTSGGFLQIAGMRFSYDPEGTPYDYDTPGSGTRVIDAWVGEVQVICDGVVLNPDAKLNIATIDFLARGGDNSPFEGDELYTLPVSYQQALKNYIVDGLGGTVTAALYPYEGEDGAGDILPGERRIMTKYDGGFSFDFLSRFDTMLGEGAAEIVTYDPATMRLFLTNAETASITVVDFSDPASPVQVDTIDVSANGEPNSCAAFDGLLAVALESGETMTPGVVAFYDTATLALISTAPAGVLPDMLTFTHDGSKVVVANEGEPDDDYENDPEGSVTVIDVTDPAAPVSTQIDFNAWDAERDNLIAAGVRIFGMIQPGDTLASVSQDLEPEYIAVAADDSMAYVVCQENNALVHVDLATNTVTDIQPLGTKDWSSGPMLDASNKDDGDGGPAINMQNWPVKTFYMPDAIAGYCAGGEFYIVTANEGDARDYDGFSEEERVKDLTLDATAFPDAAMLQEDGNLGRLKITTAHGDTDDDGDYDEIYGYGGRSFSIFSPDSGLVYDSGDEFESYIAANYPAIFNMNDGLASEWDNRSDDKGPEPEGVALGYYRGVHLAFIGLERQGGMFIYDISDPAAASRLDYFTTNGAGDGTDAAPEGVLFIPADKSPNGKPLALYSSELSGTLVITEVNLAE